MGSVRPGEERHLEVTEVDTSPDVMPVHKMIYPNMTVVDNGNGSVSILLPAAGTASGLQCSTGSVDVSAAPCPIAGQVLTTTSPTAANWQSPAGGDSRAFLIGLMGA